MAVPKYNEFFPSFLLCLQDGMTHPLSEIYMFCAKACSVTPEEQRMQLASGKNMFKNRVCWASTYLKKAGLIESPARGRFCLTESGKQAVANGADTVTLQYLQSIPSFANFFQSAQKDESAHPSGENTQDAENPQEALENAFAALNASLADDLTSELLKISDYDFEKLVVKLLIKMGYGSLPLNTDAVTKKSGDEGIDGIVTADKFGFDSVYIQAKHWKPDVKVGRPEVQKFLGALAGQGATKGLFITTADFSKEAIQFANKQLHSKIVLVNGIQLAQLMIEYNLGVSTTSVYEVKRVDTDFFSDDF